jgi:phosphopantetheinyl transferase
MRFKIVCLNFDEALLKPVNWNLNVYCGNSEQLAGKIPLLLSLLSESEKARASRFRLKTDFNCYVSVHGLLRIELSKLLNKDPRSIVFSEQKNGKPFIPGSDLPFNLSRSKTEFTFVIGEPGQFIGIDIERIKPGIDIKAISKNYFNVKEQDLISSCENTEDQNLVFFKLWTRKEAILKAIGTGISAGLSNVLVLDGVNQTDIEDYSLPVNEFRISTTLRNNTLISIASSVDFIPRFNQLA